MNYKHTLLFLWVVLMGTPCVHGQTITCPPNIDFELGNTSIWNYSTGTCCPIATPTAGPAIMGRHTLVTGPGLDYYGGFPVVAPGGGSYSLKLGNATSGGQAEKATYFVHVPATTSSYSLIYRYAVVFADPGHSPAQQPRFEVNTSDSASGAPIPCAHFVHISAPGLPGFQVSPVTSSVYYKDWATGVLNLSGLAGSTVRVEFATGDCGLGGHFGYGYLDMSCGLFEIMTAVCDTDSVTLSAPVGFHAYAWYDATFTTVIDTARVATIATPPGTTTYAVVLFPYPGTGCSDTLYRTVVPSHLNHIPMPDTFTCGSSSILLHPHATDGTNPLTYAWSSPGVLACSTCDSVFVSPSVTTQYVVTVTNPSGCSISDTVTVSPGLTISAMADTSRCDNAGVLLAPSVSGYFSPFAYSWAPATGLSCSTCSSTTATNDYTTTYALTVSDTLGCTLHDTVIVARGRVTVKLREDTVLCASMPITVNAYATDTANPASFTYAWTSSGTLPCTTCSTMVITPITSGQYIVVATNSFGCTASDTLNVGVSLLTVATTDGTLCNQHPFPMATSVSGAFAPFTYSWAPATGLSCSTCLSPVSTGTVSETYIVSVTDTAGCMITDTATILRGEIMIAPIPDSFFCSGAGVPMACTITGADYPLTYSWAPATGLSCANCVSTVATPLVTTTYIVTVTNSLGCVVADTVKIVPDYYTLTVPHDTVVCVDLPVPLSISTTATSPTTQVWAPATGLNTTTEKSVTANTEYDVTYVITITDSLGCSLTDSVRVERNTLMMYTVEDKVICEEERVSIGRAATFDAYPVSYSWTPAESLDCATCEAPFATPKKTTTYVLVATDETGCYLTDSVTINVEMCDIWFPNAFTPNGDGKNDIARVVGHLRFYTNYSLFIYNRFGEVVYTTNDILGGWDGMYKGTRADLGVYFYKIQYTLNERTHMLKGDLTLVR